MQNIVSSWLTCLLHALVTEIVYRYLQARHVVKREFNKQFVMQKYIISTLLGCGGNCCAIRGINP